MSCYVKVATSLSKQQTKFADVATKINKKYFSVTAKPLFSVQFILIFTVFWQLHIICFIRLGFGKGHFPTNWSVFSDVFVLIPVKN